MTSLLYKDLGKLEALIFLKQEEIFIPAMIQHHDRWSVVVASHCMWRQKMLFNYGAGFSEVLSRKTVLTCDVAFWGKSLWPQSKSNFMLKQLLGVLVNHRG